MNPNNSEFIVEGEMNESDFTEVTSIGIDMKQIVGKIQKLENMTMKNAKGLSNGAEMMQIGWQMGKEIGELKKENECSKDGMAKILKELEGLKEGNKEMKAENVENYHQIKKENADGIGKMMKTFEELKEIVGKLAEENDKLKKGDIEKCQEMERMKKSIEGLKMVQQNVSRATEELKEENGRKLWEMSKLIAQIGGKNAELEERIVKNAREMEEMRAALNGLKNGIDGKNVEIDGQIARLKEEKEISREKAHELEKRIEQMANLTIYIGEIKWVKYNSNTYKMDSAHCGPKLTISGGGFVVKNSGPEGNNYNTALATLPIPAYNLLINKPTIAYYFELKILKTNWNRNNIGIGFCEKQIPLPDHCLGSPRNSFSIYVKGAIWIDGTLINLGNVNGDRDFKEGDVMGLGIIYHPNSKMECFGTGNGQFLGKAEIPPKFVDIQLFPAISLYHTDNIIRANFDTDKCQFKDFKIALQ